MKLKIVAVAALALAASAPMAFAGHGNSGNTPGHMMQRFGSVPGHPGASGYAPGHLKRHHFRRSTVGFAVRQRRYHRH